MLMSKGCYYLTHGHEIGHNFGLGHESSWHGDNYRTLMNSNANAINFYSNPAVKREVRRTIHKSIKIYFLLKLSFFTGLGCSITVVFQLYTNFNKHRVK